MKEHKDPTAAVDLAAVEGQLPCRSAMRIAADCGETPLAIGKLLNRRDVRVSFCQLGLFGYTALGEKTWLRSPDHIPAGVEEALRRAADEAGDTIACAVAWLVADRLGLPRVVIGSCAEALSIRIRSCQLGCF